MAEVYRARDLRLDRMVAVKTLRHDLARDHTFQERFRREAQSAASLNHSSIIAVFDTGEDMVDGLAIPFIIMEYVDGRTLKELLDDDRRLLPERCAEVTEGILRALEYSHQNGIVHRDIKPANVMLTRAAEVKVMDFGIARAMNDNQATMTQASQVIGTAQYLSPEQARGERVDARSDIYSTGCVLYELLTGGPPFTGDSPVSIAYQHVREDPVPPSQVDPEVPAWVEQVVLRAMTKDREDRYQTAEEMRQDIQRGLQGMPTEASTMAMAPAPAGSTTALPPVDNRGRDDYDDDDYYDDRDQGKGRRTALWIVLAVAVLAALGFAVWLFNQPTAESISIPKVQGMEQSEAQNTLSEQGFTNVSVEEENHDDIAEGNAIGTDPPAGQERSPGSDITLRVSSGPGAQQIPDVVGQDRETATQMLQDEGFEVGDTSEEASASYDEGQVIRTSPPGGQSADPGSRIDLVISTGPEQVAVPDLSNQTQDEAESTLSDLGLTPSFQEEASEDVEPGRVVRQDPGAGTEVDPGSSVTVFIATEPEEPETPPTTDLPETPEDGNTGDQPPPGWPTELPWNPGNGNGEE
ncbi:Stk1 family PASTA domain-containing Ser/Thr kinase [Streptomonospora sediminis]